MKGKLPGETAGSLERLRKQMSALFSSGGPMLPSQALRNRAPAAKRQTSSQEDSLLASLSGAAQQVKRECATIQSSRPTYPILCPDISFPNCEPVVGSVSPGPLTVSVDR